VPTARQHGIVIEFDRCLRKRWGKSISESDWCELISVKMPATHESETRTDKLFFSRRPGLDRGWTGTRPTASRGAGGVSRVDPGPQPLSQKGLQMGGRTLAGTQPHFHIWYRAQWTGLRPHPAFSGGLPYIVEADIDSDCPDGKTGPPPVTGNCRPRYLVQSEITPCSFLLILAPSLGRVSKGGARLAFIKTRVNWSSD
jgi:hypothetical protein